MISIADGVVKKFIVKTKKPDSFDVSILEEESKLNFREYYYRDNQFNIVTIHHLPAIRTYSPLISNLPRTLLKTK